MFERLIDAIQTLGPALLVSWGLTMACVLLRPQRYINSILLMFSLLISLIFVGSLLGDDSGYFLVACYLLAMLALLIVPFLLIINGIQLIRREGLSLAHLLSIGLGIFVGAGETAAVFFVVGLPSFGGAEGANPWMLILSMSVFYFSFLVLSFVVYTVFIQIIPRRMNFDYVIIHGCGLTDDGRPTKLLSNRIDKAIEVYEKCAEKPFIIPSGGQGADEVVSEAEAMRRYLVEHGIPDGRIILEDRSTTTEENVRFSKEIVDARGGGKVALVSSNYHVYRCLRIAREEGLRCTGIGAKVALYFWPSALIREFVAIFVTHRFLAWAFVGYALFIAPFFLANFL